MKKFIAFIFKSILKKLHNAGHADFYNSGIIAPLIPLMSALPTVSGIFNALQTVYQKEDELFKQSQASVLTKDIRWLHEKRIALYLYFWHIVGMSKYLDDAALLQASKKLLFLRNNYKELPKANYTDASGLLTNFLEDCEKPEWEPLIQAFGLTALVGKIKIAHETFTALYRERSFDKVHTSEIGKLRGIRVEVDTTFAALVDSINVAWFANELGSKDAIVRSNLLEVREHIAAAIHQVEHDLARRRHHKTKDEDKKDDATQTPGTTSSTTLPQTNISSTANRPAATHES